MHLNLRSTYALTPTQATLSTDNILRVYESVNPGAFSLVDSVDVLTLSSTPVDVDELEATLLTFAKPTQPALVKDGMYRMHYE